MTHSMTLILQMLLVFITLHTLLLSTVSSSKSTSMTHPLLMWSGPSYAYLKSAHHTQCQSKVKSLHSIVDDIANHRESLLTTGLQEKPEAMVSFVFKNLRTSDFMKWTGSFENREKRNNAFSALQTHVEKRSGSSLTFSDCMELDHQILNPSSVVKGQNAVEELIKKLKSSALGSNVMQDISNLVVEFDQPIHADQVKTIDNAIDMIIMEINRLTHGNFVASASSDISELITAETTRVKNQVNNNKNIHSLDGVPQTRTELYIDSTAVAGISIGIFTLGGILLAFYFLSRISASPHITDAFQADEQKKKMQ